MDGATASFHIIIKIYSIHLQLSNSSRLLIFLFVVVPICGPASVMQTNKKLGKSNGRLPPINGWLMSPC